MTTRLALVMACLVLGTSPQKQPQLIEGDLRKTFRDIAANCGYRIAFDKDVGGTVSVESERLHPIDTLCTMADKYGLCVRKMYYSQDKLLVVLPVGEDAFSIEPCYFVKCHRNSAADIEAYVVRILGPEARLAIDSGAGFYAIFGEDKFSQEARALAGSLDSGAGQLLIQLDVFLCSAFFPIDLNCIRSSHRSGSWMKIQDMMRN